MSSYAALYTRTPDVDFMVIANDTAVMTRVPIEKDGEVYNKTHHSFTSKSIYFQHLRASVIVTGSTDLYDKVVEFINKSRIYSYDGLLDAFRTDLSNYIKDFTDNYPWDFSNKYSHPNLLGQIIAHGLSTHDDNGEKRERNLLLGRRLHVLRDGVKDCGCINPEKNDYEGVCSHLNDGPILPIKDFERIVDQNHELLNENFQVGAMNIVKQQLIRSNELFNLSGRERIFSAGEIHGTVYQCLKNDKYGDTLTVTQMLLHRFEDYDDLRAEQDDFHRRVKNGEVKMDVIDSLMSDTLNKIRKDNNEN